MRLRAEDTSGKCVARTVKSPYTYQKEKLMPKLTVAVCLVLVSLLLFTTFAQAQTRIAVINTRDVLTKCEPGAQAISAIQNSFAERRKQMSGLEQELRKLQEEAKGEKSPAASQMQAKLQKFREEDQKFKQDLSQEEGLRLKPVADKINKVISDYAKSKGISGVQERGAFVYVDYSLDITDEIIKLVNQEK